MATLIRSKYTPLSPPKFLIVTYFRLKYIDGCVPCILASFVLANTAICLALTQFIVLA